MSKQLIERKERGRLIAQANGLIKKNGEISYTVSSQCGNGYYDVMFTTEFGWNCSCPDLCTEVLTVNIFMPYSLALLEGSKNSVNKYKPKH